MEDLLTPEEKATQQTLTENLAKAVMAIPRDTGFDGLVKYENFFEVPSATVLKVPWNCSQPRTCIAAAT